MSAWPIAVVGAGAAGLTAALFAARAGRRVALLETRQKPGAKIRVSGGGRCNVLPSQVDLDDFHTAGSRPALRNVLYSWPLADVQAFFERDLGVPLKTEPTGKMFPVSERPLDVVEAILAAGERAGVQLVGGFRVAELFHDPSRPAPFRLRGEDGREIEASRVVLATGGLSLPKTGSDGAGFRFARALGLEVVPTYPALVPLTTGVESWRALTGISLPVRLRIEADGRIVEDRERELLFTHRGFSGPAILDASRWWTQPGGPGRFLARWGGSASPDWEAELRPQGKRQVATILRRHLPDRLADVLLDLAGVPRDRRESDLPRAERLRLVEVLERCPLPVEGDEGYATAEVTGGGVPLSELHLSTLESRRVPGLHLCGELLDATGRIGGYNFLWAWVTGRKAGLGAAQAG